MCLIFSFFPATFWLMIGFFVMFASSRADGNVQKFGKILSYWIFFLAAMIPVMGAIATISGLCPIDRMMQ